MLTCLAMMENNLIDFLQARSLNNKPMPFEKLTGPECWDLPALMPDKSYYNSRLSGEVQRGQVQGDR